MVEPRVAVETIQFVRPNYYADLPTPVSQRVRSSAALGFHLDMISRIPRKSLPTINKAVGL